MALGYLSAEWTVAVLAGHLRRTCHCPLVGARCGADLRPWGWRGNAHGTYTIGPIRTCRKKGALVRRVKRLEKNVVVLFEGETILRLFPPLRAKWAFRGDQSLVRISGEYVSISVLSLTGRAYRKVYLNFTDIGTP